MLNNAICIALVCGVIALLYGGFTAACAGRRMHDPSQVVRTTSRSAFPGCLSSALSAA